ncbi:MAG: VCBS repeat-containing protein, partial [Myxococcales bacterium]|nr:VCBS repeat-containing protein [Myxococcales bacterium]
YLPVGAIGDFDGDGTLDAIAPIYNDVYVARGAGDGSFGPLSALSEDPDFDAIGPRYGVGLDVNKDGVHDLLRSKSAGTTFTLVFSMSAP